MTIDVRKLLSELAEISRKISILREEAESDIVIRALLSEEARLVSLIQSGGGAVIGEDVQTGGGDFIGRDSMNSTIQTSGGPYIEKYIVGEIPSISTVRWKNRNKSAINYFLSLCDGITDEDELQEVLESWGLLMKSSNGLFFSTEGILLFGPKEKVPANYHTDVQIFDSRQSPEILIQFDGECIIYLFSEIRKFLSKLWESKIEIPEVRDELGKPVTFSIFPVVAMIEALVNFLIHRDYTKNDMAYITITNEYIEFVNPGLSPYSEEELLTSKSPLRPKYSRNVNIIKAVSRTRLNQRQGGGIIRIRKELERNENLIENKLGLIIENQQEKNRFKILIFSRKIEDRQTENLLANRQLYVEYSIDRHQYLQFKGMGVSEKIPLRLPLLDVYVPLEGRLELPEGETWRRLQLAGRALPEEEQALRLSEPQPVLELLQKHAGLIILGDPGAGKTTFLKFLALQLAFGQEEALGLGPRLPILLPLSAYANALQQGDVRLDDFITHYFDTLGANLPLAAILTEALAKGAALILLDGLDEVKDLALRNTVVERVTDFYSFHRRKGNKFVLTSRIVGYRQVRLTATDLAECTLVDFDDDEIEAFITRWTSALEKQASGETAVARADAAREKAELLDAVQRNPGVRRLAANPLLLTILALMKRQGVTLPERRVQLYDQYVSTLLSQWNRARSLSGRGVGRDLDDVQTLRLLAPLALWMHETNPGIGLVKREDLRRKLEAMLTALHDPDPIHTAQTFLEDVREHAALLLERGPEEYGFIHLTFEEYLSAVALALRAQGQAQTIVDYLTPHVGEQAWREITLLTVAYLGIRQQLPEVAGQVVEGLIACAGGPPGEATVLAGEAVLDALPGGVLPTTKDRAIVALIPAMQNVNADSATRRRAGMTLGRLGWIPSDLDAFIYIPAGKFLYGDEKEEREIPYDYWIGKYPVTNLQYRQFIENGGYEQKEFWSEIGWNWRIGKDHNFSVETNETLRTIWDDWLRARPVEQRSQPWYWHDSDWNNALFPVVGITWYEAEAYGNWMRTQPLSVSILEGYSIRLPTEVEWERAARGTDGREYPWGQAAEHQFANFAEELGSSEGTSSVVTYPQGGSLAGAWDMSGNVWEWTNSWYEKPNEYSVVRGGSWALDFLYSRCAYRLRAIPGYFSDDYGFRLVVSPSQGD